MRRGGDGWDSLIPLCQGPPGVAAHLSDGETEAWHVLSAILGNNQDRRPCPVWGHGLVGSLVSPVTHWPHFTVGSWSAGTGSLTILW